MTGLFIFKDLDDLEEKAKSDIPEGTNYLQVSATLFKKLLEHKMVTASISNEEIKRGTLDDA